MADAPPDPAPAAELLPLFPLGSVLYPGLVLQLHVFEERYRRLVRELLDRPEGAARRFGVVAIREGREVGVDGARALHAVGCTAQLRRAEPYDDGRFDIACVGATRFVLHGVDDTAPYLRGRVSWLEEEVGDADVAPVLARGVGRVFGDYLGALAAAQGGALDPPELPDDPLLVSYLVSATCLLDQSDKQALLACGSAVDRLRLGLRLLKRETTMLRRLAAVPALDLVRVEPGPN